MTYVLIIVVSMGCSDVNVTQQIPMSNELMCLRAENIADRQPDTRSFCLQVEEVPK